MADTSEVIKLKSRIFNLSSNSFSVNYSGSAKNSGKFIIPNFIKQTDNISHTYLLISHAEVPNSFYLINTYNNKLNINNINYFIPYGNYNIRTLIDSLEIILPSEFTLTFNQVTQKIVVISTNAFTIYYNNSTINKIMGFPELGNISGLFAIDVYACELPYVVNFLPLSRINFKCSNLHLQNYQSDDSSSDLLLSLQNNATVNGLITYVNSDNLKYHIDLASVNELEIRVTDDLARPIDFNNINWYLTLRIDYEYHSIISDQTLNTILKSKEINLD